MAREMKGRAVNLEADSANWQRLLEEEGMKFRELPAADYAKIRATALGVLTGFIKRTGGRNAEAWEVVEPIIVPPTEVGKFENPFTK